MSDVEEIQDIDKKSFWYAYPREVLEAFVILLIIQGIMDKEINFFSILKIACVIGLIVFIAINVIDTEFNRSVKDGLRNSVGYYIFANISQS